MNAHGVSPAVLYPRQRQVVAMLAPGLHLSQVAEMLHIAPKTVDSARQSAYKKLGIHDRVVLARWAIHHGVDVRTPLDWNGSATTSGVGEPVPPTSEPHGQSQSAPAAARLECVLGTGE